MLHALPYHNPTVLAGVIHATDILTGGRYEWGVGRGHGWIPLPAGEPLDEHARPRYEEAVDLLLKALENERFSHEGTYFHVADSHVVPFVDRKYRVYLGGTSDRTYTLAAERGWGVAVPPLLPVRRAREADGPLPRVLRRARHRAGHRLDPRVPPRRGPRDSAPRGARVGDGFITGNASPLTEWPKPPADDLNKAGYGFYAAGIMEVLAEVPYDKLIEDDYVWVGTPPDVIERIEATRKVCEGIQEIGDHRQRRRRAALDGDQEPGAVRERCHAALRPARRSPRADSTGSRSSRSWRRSRRASRSSRRATSGTPYGLTTTAVVECLGGPADAAHLRRPRRATLPCCGAGPLCRQLHARGAQRPLSALCVEDGRQVRSCRLEPTVGGLPLLEMDVLAWAECTTTSSSRSAITSS